MGCFKRTASKHVYYLGWNRSPAQVGCMRQALGPGALGKPRRSGWRGRWEGRSGWGTHVNPWLIHYNVWQTHYNKNKKRKEKKKKYCITLHFTNLFIAQFNQKSQILILVSTLNLLGYVALVEMYEDNPTSQR